MQETLEETMRSYKAAYSQEVRDLAETFCSATTRMGGVQEREPRELTQDVRRRATAHGIDIDVLTQAVAHYTRIETLAEASYRKR